MLFKFFKKRQKKNVVDRSFPQLGKILYFLFVIIF